MDSPVRTRFCLVPDGPLRIDAARVALYSWLLARQAGGRFLLRVEDIDRAPGAVGMIEPILEDLRWLGLDWDEGPYWQSRQVDSYEPYYSELIASGSAYYTFDTPAELDQMRRQALAAWRPFRYPQPKESPDARQVQQARQEGRPVLLRFRMPGRDITVDDLVLGPVTIPADELDDFVIRSADGRATWLFATVIDDERMGITHVVRGQAQLPYMHRHVAVQEALGLRTPVYAHLPLMLESDGGPLAGELDVRDFRAAGYLPEVLVDLLSHLGWPLGQGLSRDDLVRRFDIRQVSRTAVRFDRRKLLALNAQAMAEAREDRLLAGLRDYLAVNDTPLKVADDITLRQLLRLVPAAQTFREVDRKCRVFFVADEEVVYDDAAVRKLLAPGDPRAFAALERVQPLLAALATWDVAHLERGIEEMGEQAGLPPGRLARLIRIAVTGRAGNLPIGLSLAVLGRERTLSRMSRCVAVCRADV